MLKVSDRTSGLHAHKARRAILHDAFTVPFASLALLAVFGGLDHTNPSLVLAFARLGAGAALLAFSYYTGALWRHLAIPQVDARLRLLAVLRGSRGARAARRVIAAEAVRRAGERAIAMLLFRRGAHSVDKRARACLAAVRHLRAVGVFANHASTGAKGAFARRTARSGALTVRIPDGRTLPVFSRAASLPAADGRVLAILIVRGRAAPGGRRAFPVLDAACAGLAVRVRDCPARAVFGGAEALRGARFRELTTLRSRNDGGARRIASLANSRRAQEPFTAIRVQLARIAGGSFAADKQAEERGEAASYHPHVSPISRPQQAETAGLTGCE